MTILWCNQSIVVGNLCQIMHDPQVHDRLTKSIPALALMHDS